MDSGRKKWEDESNPRKVRGKARVPNRMARVRCGQESGKGPARFASYAQMNAKRERSEGAHESKRSSGVSDMIMLTHDSALAFWRAASVRGCFPTRYSGRQHGAPEVPTREEVQSFFDCCFSDGWEWEDCRRENRTSSKFRMTQSRQEALSEMEDAFRREPIHAFVSCDVAKTSRSGFVLHSKEGGYPRGSFMDVGSGMYVARPELCFLQMVSRLSLLKALELGFEICGGYTVGEDGYRAAVTTSAKLQSFLARCKGIEGRRRALRAVRYVRDGSASVMETKLALVLGLPCFLGGFGLGVPSMNRVVKVTNHGRTVNPLAKREYRCDLFWEQGKVGVEYDSDLWHTGAQRIAADSKRRNDLELLGVHIVTVTNMQTKSRSALSAIAQVVAKRCGHRIRPRVERYGSLQTKLLREIGF